MEFALASFHECCFAPSTKAAHTEALEAVLHDPRVNAFGHPGNSSYDFDQEYIISRCNAFGKVVEINSNSFAIRKGSRENCTAIARLCKQYEAGALSKQSFIEQSPYTNDAEQELKRIEQEGTANAAEGF